MDLCLVIGLAELVVTQTEIQLLEQPEQVDSFHLQQINRRVRVVLQVDQLADDGNFSARTLRFDARHQLKHRQKPFPLTASTLVINHKPTAWQTHLIQITATFEVLVTRVAGSTLL